MFLLRPIKFPKGIRFRLTLVYSTLFGLFLITYAYIMSSQYIQSGRSDFDGGLLNYAIDLADHIKFDQAHSTVEFALPPSEGKKDFPFIINDTYYVLRSTDGKILGKSSNNHPFSEIPFDPELPLSPKYTHRFLYFKVGDNTFRAVNLKFHNMADESFILQVASPSNVLEEREQNQLLMTTVLVPLLILIASIVSYLISGNALEPIRKLTEAANNIAASNLSLRVPEANTADEVEELSKTFNTLLGRLEKSFKGQEHFVSNASHQLNTPLAIIKGELEVLESKPRSIEEHQKFHKSLKEELSRLIELVKNLLLISRVESGQEKFVFVPTRLDDLLLGTIARLSLKAREKKITIRFNISPELEESDLEVMGERQLLECLFENLVDNAIKYAPEESIVALDMKYVEGHYEIWISDEGPGIDESEIHGLLTNRYQRGSGINIPGTGIGLPLASQIANFHNAEINYQRLSPQGSLFKVQFTKKVS